MLLLYANVFAISVCKNLATAIDGKKPIGKTVDCKTFAGEVWWQVMIKKTD